MAAVLTTNITRLFFGRLVIFRIFVLLLFNNNFKSNGVNAILCTNYSQQLKKCSVPDFVIYKKKLNTD